MHDDCIACGKPGFNRGMAQIALAQRDCLQLGSPTRHLEYRPIVSPAEQRAQRDD